MMKGKGQVPLLMGPPRHAVKVVRTEGYIQVAKKYPGIKFVSEEFGYWSRTDGIWIVENWIQDGLVFDEVLSMEWHGVHKKYIAAGIDATPDVLEFMKSGRLDITVLQSARGRGIGEYCCKGYGGNTQRKMDLVPFESVAPENAAEYMAKLE